MYDELVKALHEGAEFLECSTPGIKNSFAKMLHNAADAIEELSRENESLAKSVNEASEALRKRRPVVRGKWINDHNGKYSSSGGNYFCSVCKDPSLRAFGKPARTNFCPNCGADMREES